MSQNECEWAGLMEMALDHWGGDEGGAVLRTMLAEAKSERGIPAPVAA